MEMKKLDRHLCAYCGSSETELTNVEYKTSYDLVLFTVHCKRCDRVDKPSLLVQDLLALLMEVG